MVALQTANQLDLSEWVPDEMKDKFIKSTVELYYHDLPLEKMPNATSLAWDHWMFFDIYYCHFPEDRLTDEEENDIRMEYNKVLLNAVVNVLEYHNLVYEVSPLNRGFGFNHYAKEVW